MADMAFTYDNDRGFSDLKIVGGDFLLCDQVKTDFVDVESDGVPFEIIVSGTGTLADGSYERVSDFNLKPRHSHVSVTSNIEWDGSLWNVTGIPDEWQHPTDTGPLVPKTGWSIGSISGSPAPVLSYAIPTSVEESAFLISSLQVAVELSLFTDRRATSDEIEKFQRGAQKRTSRRGYWANSFREHVQGSGLWLIDREKRMAETIARAQSYATDALQWMTAEGVAQSVAATAEFDGSILVLIVAIRKPDGQDVGFKYNFAWDSLEVS